VLGKEDWKLTIEEESKSSQASDSSENFDNLYFGKNVQKAIKPLFATEYSIKMLPKDNWINFKTKQPKPSYEEALSR